MERRKENAQSHQWFSKLHPNPSHPRIGLELSSYMQSLLQPQSNACSEHSRLLLDQQSLALCFPAVFVSLSVGLSLEG